MKAVDLESERLPVGRPARKPKPPREPAPRRSHARPLPAPVLEAAQEEAEEEWEEELEEDREGADSPQWTSEPAGEDDTPFVEPPPSPPHSRRRDATTVGQRTEERLQAQASAAQRHFARKVSEALIDNVETMIELAKGIWIEETAFDGKRRVYRQPPDKQVLMFLVEQGIGKATAREKQPVSQIINLVHRVPRAK